MSFIVKGINLPKDGENIRLAITSSGDVVEVWSSGLAKAYHPCQAIQIPKDHGRIGDFDLLKEMVRDSVPAYGIGVKIPTYGDMDIMDKISIMPAILEAEED